MLLVQAPVPIPQGMVHLHLWPGGLHRLPDEPASAARERLSASTKLDPSTFVLCLCVAPVLPSLSRCSPTARLIDTHPPSKAARLRRPPP